VKVAAYQLMRILRWLLWIGFVGHSLYFVYDRAPHLTQFGHLTMGTELAMFGLALGGILAGLLELMLRDWAYPPQDEALR
jgi:hypothetical protein